MTACCAACRHIKRISTQHTPGRRKTLLHTMIQGWRHANTQDCGQAFGVQPGAGLQRFACLNAHCRRTFATAQACGARLLVLLCMLFTVSAVPVDWCSVLGLGCAAVPSPPPRHTAPAASTSAHLLCPNDVHHVNCWWRQDNNINAASLVRLVGAPMSTAKDWVRRFRAGRGAADAPRSGRPCSLSDDATAVAVSLVRKPASRSTAKAAAALEALGHGRFHKSTVRRALRFALCWCGGR